MSTNIEPWKLRGEDTCTLYDIQRLFAWNSGKVMYDKYVDKLPPDMKPK